MRFLSHYLPPFLIAWMTTFSVASVLHSQFVVNELIAIGVKINGTDRLSLTIDDWVGLLPTYGAIIAIGLVLAFVVTHWLLQRTVPAISKRALMYGVAGALAIAVILLAMRPIMGITLIAGARELGFYAQMLAGAFGGWVFAKYTT